MRKYTLICIIALSVAGGAGGGYLVRAQRTDGSLVLSLNDAVQLEHLASQDTFSRVRNTRNTLDALSARSAIEIMDALRAHGQLPKNNDLERTKAREALEHIINAAEEAVQEFEGTAQQLQVTQSLLLALQRAERFDRWTEVYLKALYEHPSHPFVTRLANDAIKNSKRAGQQDRVFEALSILNAFGPTLEGKAHIEAALNAANPCLSQMQFSCAAAGAEELEQHSPLD